MSSFRRQERPAQPTYLKRKGSFLTSCQLPGGGWLSVPPLPGSLSVSPSWDFLPGVREPCFLLSYSLITRHLSAPPHICNPWRPALGQALEGDIGNDRDGPVLVTASVLWCRGQSVPRDGASPMAPFASGPAVDHLRPLALGRRVWF